MYSSASSWPPTTTENSAAVAAPTNNNKKMSAFAAASRRSKGWNVVRHLVHRQAGVDLDSRMHLYRNRMSVARNLYNRNLVAHYGCVNAIEFSGDGELMVSGGDDRRVLVWRMSDVMEDRSMVEPLPMFKQHHSNIFCLSFNNDQTKILSGGNDDAVLVHDVHTAANIDVFLHTKPVYGLSVDPNNDHYFGTAGEDGRVLIFDRRAGAREVLALAKNRAPFHAVQFHPIDEHFVITANGKDGAAIWDKRQTRAPTIRYSGDDAAQSCMSVCFNSLGTQVLALRRRLPPILYNTCSAVPIAQFYHPDYYNSCTMKSCCFAGENDELVMSGSDDFNLYVWRVGEAASNATNQWIDNHHMVLYGHRSIVNQVRYNPQRCCIASSGVEKVIKMWTPFGVPGWSGSLTEETVAATNGREVFTHDEYMSIINTSGLNMTHDYSHQNTMEDPRMMAFFDSLVQREIEGWVSNDGSDKSSEHSSDGSSRPTSTEASSDDSEDDSMTNYVMSNTELRRRARYAMRPRATIYANRIAYLIATKRNTLKRLALKGAAHSERRVRINSKLGGRKLGARITRKCTGKRSSRSVTNKRTAVSHEDHDDPSHPQAQKKFTKRRIPKLNVNDNYRVFRRKSKAARTSRHIESPDTSDDDDDVSGENAQRNGESSTSGLPQNHNMPTTSAGPSTSTSSSRVRPNYPGGFPSTSKKYDPNKNNPTVRLPSSSSAVLVRHCARFDTSTSDGDEDTETTSTTDSNRPLLNIAVPSTSTGITSPNGPLIRSQLQQLIEDSDDEEDDTETVNSQVESLNLIPVIPMPLNGTHNFDAAYSSGIDEDDGYSEQLPPTNDTIDLEDSNNDPAPEDPQQTPQPQQQPTDENHEFQQYFNNNQVRRKRNATSASSTGNTSSSARYMAGDNYSSHSNSRMSNSSPDIDSQKSSSGRNAPSDVCPTGGSTNKKPRLRDSPGSGTSGASNFHDTQTPAGSSKVPATTKNNRTHSVHFTPDSGIVTLNPNSASSSTEYHSGSSAPDARTYAQTQQLQAQPGPSSSSAGPMASSSTSYSHRLFQQKVARIRRNYRNNFGDDSDSD